MARKKVNLQWIANDSSRRATYNKRRKGLMKKASELATLCGVKACVVVYGEGQVQPEVWPSAPEAKKLLKRFKAMPDLQNLKKSFNQEDFLHGRISKLHNQVCKSNHENNEREASNLVHETMVGHRLGLVGVTVEELTSLSLMVERKIKNVKERLQQLAVWQGRPCLAPQLPLQLQPSLSSTQLQAPNSSTEMQTLAPMDEPPHQTQQQDWLANLAPNRGEASTMVCNVFAGSSSGCARPSGSGSDIMQPFNLGSSGFSCLWDLFPPME